MHMFNNVSTCFFRILRTNHMKAFACKLVGRNEDALKYCEKELNMNGENKRTLAMKVEILQRLKRYEDAILSCDEFTRMHGEQSAIMRIKGEALCDLEKVDEATIVLKDALVINPGDWEALVLLAKIMLKRRKYEDAVIYCDKAIKYNENAFEAYDLRQTALHELGFDEESMSQEEKELTRKAVKEVLLGDDEYECEEFNCNKRNNDACLFISPNVNA